MMINRREEMINKVKSVLSEYTDMNFSFFTEGESIINTIDKKYEISESIKFNVSLDERAISTETRKDLKDSDFGLPETRSFPLIDKEHVKKAIQFFKYCPYESREELANRIKNRADELDIEINNPLVLQYVKVNNKIKLKEDVVLSELDDSISIPIEAAVILFEDYCLMNESFNIDKNGSIIIKLREKTNFKEKYALSNKLITLYMENGNVEGVKYELCKLYYMMTIIDKYYIYSPKSKLIDETKRNDAVSVKSFIVNDFNKGLKYVIENENDFNFTTYFESTPYNKDLIKIETSHIEGLKKLIQAVI